MIRGNSHYPYVSYMVHATGSLWLPQNRQSICCSSVLEKVFPQKFVKRSDDGLSVVSKVNGHVSYAEIVKGTQ